jgi:hypothetical protein
VARSANSENLGPPEGSFLDVLFKRFGIDVPQGARLSSDAVEGWFREFWVMKELKQRLAVPKIPVDALDRLIVRAGPQVQHPAGDAISDHLQALAPETLRTFWHGETINPYQLMCLKSFAAAGHRIEVYSYAHDLNVPDWLNVENAAAILPRERVEAVGQEGAVAIHANLFAMRCFTAKVDGGSIRMSCC